MRRGLSLAELIVATGLFLLLMVGGVAVMDFISKAGMRSRAKIEPRQQVRSLVGNLAQDLRGAGYIWDNWSGTLLGQPIVTPAAGGGPASALLFAVPQDSSPDPEYQVCLLCARARKQPDPNNPGVREILYERFAPQKSLPALTPGALDPTALSPQTSKVFDCYIPPGNANLAFSLTPTRDGVDITIHFVQQPERGSAQTEAYRTFLTMRNNL